MQVTMDIKRDVALRLARGVTAERRNDYVQRLTTHVYQIAEEIFCDITAIQRNNEMVVRTVELANQFHSPLSTVFRQAAEEVFNTFWGDEGKVFETVQYTTVEIDVFDDDCGPVVVYLQQPFLMIQEVEDKTDKCSLSDNERPGVLEIDIQDLLGDYAAVEDCQTRREFTKERTKLDEDVSKLSKTVFEKIRSARTVSACLKSVPQLEPYFGQDNDIDSLIESVK